MNQNTRLLERMASISPGVRAHLGGEIWQEHLDEDEVTPETLVLECFSLMIDESYELGLEFYCSRADLCDNFYHLDRTLLLFEVVYPTPLYHNIIEDEGFKRWILATVRDGGGDPDNSTIIDLLQYLAIDHPKAGDTFYDTYTFLHDKLLSTPVFDIYVMSILETDITQLDVPTDPETLSSYLTHIKTMVDKQLRAIDYLKNTIPTLQININVQYNRLDMYKANTTTADALAKYVWVYQMQQRTEIMPTPIEQALIARFTLEFESTTPFYENYFQQRNQPLTQDDQVSLILGCFLLTTTKEAFVFQVDATFARLSNLIAVNNVSNQVFISTICFKLTQEFYS